LVYQNSSCMAVNPIPLSLEVWISLLDVDDKVEVGEVPLYGSLEACRDDWWIGM
jgi:hypothetical protein